MPENSNDPLPQQSVEPGEPATIAAETDTGSGAPETAENPPPPVLGGSDRPRFAPERLLPGPYSILTGPAGLRAGWSLLLYAGLMLGTIIAVAIAAVIVIVFIAHGDMKSVGRTLGQVGQQSSGTFPVMLTMEILQIIMVFIPMLLIGLIERRRLREYGLGFDARRGKQLLWGCFWGAVSFSLLAGLLAACGVLVFDGHPVFTPQMAVFGLGWLLTFGGVGFFEEILFRGYSLFTLGRGLGHRGWGFWIASVLLSVGFGAIHSGNPGETPIGLFSAGLIGFVFCLSLWYTRSLWWAIGFHAFWDWTQSFIFGVADSGTMVRGHLLSAHPQGNVLLSGGTVGPEGSVLVIPICAFATLVIFLTLRKERARDTAQAVINPVSAQLLESFLPITENAPLPEPAV